MSKAKTYFSEARERAVWLVQERRGAYPSLWVAIESVSSKIGCSGNTLHAWVECAKIDAEVHPGVTSAEAQRLKEQEYEVKELRWANEILCTAAAFSRRWSQTAN